MAATMCTCRCCTADAFWAASFGAGSPEGGDEDYGQWDLFLFRVRGKHKMWVPLRG